MNQPADHMGEQEGRYSEKRDTSVTAQWPGRHRAGILLLPIMAGSKLCFINDPPSQDREGGLRGRWLLLFIHTDLLAGEWLS